MEFNQGSELAKCDRILDRVAAVGAREWHVEAALFGMKPVCGELPANLPNWPLRHGAVAAKMTTHTHSLSLSLSRSLQTRSRPPGAAAT